MNRLVIILLIFPLSSPFKCPSGKCVKEYLECSPEYYLLPCKDNEIYCTALSSCVNSAQDCIGKDFAAGLQIGTSRRILQTKNTNPNSLIISRDNMILDQKIVPENQCTSEVPYSCYDGTCRAQKTDCPVIPACNMMEYRCANGSCQKDSKKCNVNSVTCEQGLNKCEDGICRKECPQYNGCGLASPFQCSNGMCVKNLLECVGYSMCQDPGTVFRCIDGTCMDDASKCSNIKRLNSPPKISISISKLSGVKAPIVYDKLRRNIASILIPGNSIQFNTTNLTFTNLHIDEVPHSTLYSSFINYNNSDVSIFNISNGIPASGGILDFENSVLSPIIQISGDNLNDQFVHKGILNIEHNYYLGKKFIASDYCLAKLLANQWICVDRKQTDSQKDFSFDSFGIYAVILNPNRQFTYIDTSDSSNFFFDNIKIIAVVFGSFFFSTLIIYYIFSRVIRYREKYHEHKEKMINLQNQIQDYRQMTTDAPGQTLADNLAGIFYTINPAHSIISQSGGLLQETESEIEDLQRKCKNTELQNKIIEDKITEMNELYRLLKSEIDRLKR